MAESARILVVANRTAATPALIEAVRERARRGPCSFALLVPQLACEVPYGDEEARKTLELAIPLLEEAAGGTITPMIGAADAFLAVERVLLDGVLTQPNCRRLGEHDAADFRREHAGNEHRQGVGRSALLHQDGRQPRV
jgi:hypothetical protein